jgi:energy-converting hydrogenase A subunit R
MTAIDKRKGARALGEQVFVTDCEGPISKNDNAFELTSYYIPRGDEFYKRISRYDDILADVVKKRNYKAGDTLKLILPFLKAYGAVDDAVIEYSKQNVLLISGAGETLTFVKKLMPSYIVSTSYTHYIKAVCDVTDFPSENTYSTTVQFDKYTLSDDEENKLKQFCHEILNMRVLNLISTTREEIPDEDKHILERLNEIFWDEISSMHCGAMLSEVNPIGGEGKAAAVEEIISKNHCSFDDIIYVGDSITDVAPLRRVKEAGGVAVSFNGNEYALREAEIAVISGTTIATTVLAYLYKRGGRYSVFEAVSNWTADRLKKLNLPSGLLNALISYSSEIPVEVSEVTEENRMSLIEKSNFARKTVRGKAVGSLG